MFPSFRPSGELYFSSDGRGGLGGLDLFYAVEDTVSKEWSATHLPAPMNSSGNDFGILLRDFTTAVTLPLHALPEAEVGIKFTALAIPKQRKR
jgi:hypothetical protein